jgi:type I restriction enzyme M protein
LFIDANNISKGKTQNVRKEGLIKSLALSKIVPKKINTATIKRSRNQRLHLNIPRYVDTFEEEEAIDLKAITTELRELAFLLIRQMQLLKVLVEN